MSQLPSAKQPSQTPAAEPGLEAALQSFWEKNRQILLVLCVAALLVIVGREGWQYFAAQREQGVQEEYAKIADQPAKLQAFADANSSHALAGVAYLRVADEKYEAADYKAAATAYQKAADSLKNEMLLGRAKLGAAMSQVNGGDRAAGEKALKSIGDDAALFKGVRAEASYQLASLAAEAGKTDDVQKLVEEVSKIDPASIWAQRATLLLASKPAAPGVPVPAGDSGLSFKPTGN